MISLVGVTGLAGSGKTTAVNHLSGLSGGKVLYLGKTVLDEVCTRRLLETRDNERQVRIDLRREQGRGALAIPYVDKVAEYVGNGIPVFIDAIFTQEEFGLLASCVPNGSACLLAIDASFALRLTRLANRPERPFNAEELRERDKTELHELGTAAVIAAAEYIIHNEQTLEEFYRRLAEFVSSCA